MKREFEYCVNLRLIHPDMDPAQMASEVAMTPSHSWAKGDQRWAPNGRLLNGEREESYAYFPMGSGEDGELAKAMDRTIGVLEKHAQFFNKFGVTGGAAMLYVYWYPNGDTGEVFNIELLRRMSELGVEFGLNVYESQFASSRTES